MERKPNAKERRLKRRGLTRESSSSPTSKQKRNSNSESNETPQTETKTSIGGIKQERDNTETGFKQEESVNTPEAPVIKTELNEVETPLDVSTCKSEVPPDNGEEDESSRSVYRMAATQGPVTMKPVIQWEYNPDELIFGLYADDHHCLIGDNFGIIAEISNSGELRKKYEVSDGVICIKKDGEFFYIGCDDGSLYEFIQGNLRLLSTLRPFKDPKVTSMDVRDGRVAVCDFRHLALMNPDGDVIWEKTTGRHGRVVLIDDKSVYHGNDGGLTKYSIAGKRLWRKIITFFVSAKQTDDHIYASSIFDVVKLNKKKGDVLMRYRIGHGLDLGIDSACTEVKDGIVFVTTRNSVSCYDDETGDLIYLLEIGKLEPIRMVCFRGHLYCACCRCCMVDLRRWAVEEAHTGSRPIPEAKRLEFGKSNVDVVRPVGELDRINAINSGGDDVLVQCIREGDKLRIRPRSEGYNQDWNCQFPCDVRHEGELYLVERLIAGPGKFYRAFGSIRRIEIEIKTES